MAQAECITTARNVDTERPKKCLRPTQVRGEGARISGPAVPVACLTGAFNANSQKICHLRLVQPLRQDPGFGFAYLGADHERASSISPLPKRRRYEWRCFAAGAHKARSCRGRRSRPAGAFSRLAGPQRTFCSLSGYRYRDRSVSSWWRNDNSRCIVDRAFQSWPSPGEPSRRGWRPRP